MHKIMITRRNTFKLLAAATSADCLRLSAEEDPAGKPVPYFMKWPATDDVAMRLEQFRKEASCNQGTILLKQMFLIRPTADQKPEILQTLPKMDGKFEVQLCLAFRITCVPNAGKHRVASTLTGPDLELVVSNGLPVQETSAGGSETPAQEFWFQAVENIEPDPPPPAGEFPILALELGLTKSSKFAAEHADSPPHTWKVVCFTGVWFSIDVKDKRMTTVEPLTTTPKMETTVHFVDTSSLAIP